MAKPTLVLGTFNAKKAQELADLLAPEIAVASLSDFPSPLKVTEDGENFAQNAALKATQQARHLGQWVLGEDSGLCVDALDGAPGVYSARFAGEDSTDEANNCLLLERLKNVASKQRTAFYVCHATLADPRGEVRAEAEERCCGRILTAPRGDAGFGYDPLFEIPEYHRTFAELGAVVKAFLSHRSRAIRQILPDVRRLLATDGARTGDA